jgi:hypothetical protein
MIVWIVLWLAGMMIVLVGLGRLLLGGDLAPLPFMLIWLVAAGFGLYAGIRRLRRLLLSGQARPPAARSNWHDGIERPARADAAERDRATGT